MEIAEGSICICQARTISVCGAQAAKAHLNSQLKDAQAEKRDGEGITTDLEPRLQKRAMGHLPQLVKPDFLVLLHDPIHLPPLHLPFLSSGDL